MDKMDNKKKLTKNELAYLTLIEKGILTKKVVQFPIFNKKIGQIPQFEDIEYYSLTDDFKSDFLEYVFKTINKNIRVKANWDYKIIMKMVNSYPDKLKDKYIENAINEILQQISPTYLDDGSKKSMVLDFFDNTDYLNFYNGNNIKILMYDDIKDFIKEEAKNKTIDLLKKQYGFVIPQKKQKKTSYVWQNNPDKELPELYSLMINKYKLIAPETTYEQFKAVYTGQPIENIEPIKWHQDNASELLYFIDKLEQSNNIAHKPKRADYQKLKACFVKPDGKQFNTVWKSLKTNIEINLSPDKQKAIDELVINF